MGNNENSNIFAIIDIGQMNIRIHFSVKINHEWISKYIGLGKNQQILRQNNILV